MAINDVLDDRKPEAGTALFLAQLSFNAKKTLAEAG
jgi:hypothetical protein